jgi:hypothetical protein
MLRRSPRHPTLDNIYYDFLPAHMLVLRRLTAVNARGDREVWVEVGRLRRVDVEHDDAHLNSALCRFFEHPRYREAGWTVPCR